MSVEFEFQIVAIFLQPLAVADTGFYRAGGGGNSKGGHEKLLFGQFVPEKLHENERNWTEIGGVSLVHPLDPPITSTKHEDKQ